MRRAVTTVVTLAMGATGLLAACSSDEPSVRPSTEPSPTPTIADDGAIYVFFTTEDALLPYEKSAYVQVERARRQDDATVQESRPQRNEVKGFSRPSRIGQLDC